MITGTTKSGFSFEVDEDILNDMELIENINEMDGDILAIPKVCEKILGKDGKKRLYDHLRQDDGRVPIDKAAREITDMFVVFGKAGKNS